MVRGALQPALANIATPPMPIAAAPTAKESVPWGANVAAVPVVPQSTAAVNTAQVPGRARAATGSVALPERNGARARRRDLAASVAPELFM
jgi:hypothetical protein